MSIATAPRLEVVLDRARLHREVTFGVRLEKRREIRKVFPPKVIARARGAEPIAAPPATAERPGHRPAPRTPPARATASRVRSSPPGRQDAPAAAFPEGDITWYAIQVAATGNRARAWDLIRHLQAHGVDAYLAEDADGLAKVRVGSYRSRSEAERDLAGLKPIASGWVAHIGG